MKIKVGQLRKIVNEELKRVHEAGKGVGSVGYAKPNPNYRPPQPIRSNPKTVDDAFPRQALKIWSTMTDKERYEALREAMRFSRHAHTFVHDSWSELPDTIQQRLQDYFGV